MIEVETTLREWGKSVGLVVPKEALRHEQLKAGQKVVLLLLKKTSALKDTFGVVKLKKNTDMILKEIDKEGWEE